MYAYKTLIYNHILLYVALYSVETEPTARGLERFPQKWHKRNTCSFLVLQLSKTV